LKPIKKRPEWTYFILFPLGCVMFVVGLMLQQPIGLPMFIIGFFVAVVGFFDMLKMQDRVMVCPNPKCEKTDLEDKYCGCGEKMIRVYLKIKYCNQGHRIKDSHDDFEKCPKCGEPFAAEEGKSAHELRKEYNYYYKINPFS